MLNQSRIVPFWLFTISVINILIISQLLQDGAFMDGMLYVSVSKNLALGYGSFWNLNFSKTFLSSFHEQPPLYFGLLAMFYKILGTSMYVERLFCFICFAINAFFIHKLWKKIYALNSSIASHSWLPILFWTTIPVCFWAYINHVEETVMSVFTIASVYYLYSALFLKEKMWQYILLGGFFIFLASLTKGLQGLFPLTAIGTYWLMTKKISFKKMIMYTFLLLSVSIICYGLLIVINPNVYISYQKYFETRLIRTFNNVGSTTANRFELLIVLFQELLPIALITFLILFFTKKFKANDFKHTDQTKAIFWFFLIGLSGALPLMVTLEQRGFYLVTTMPFFAIAIAMILAPRLTTLTNKINIETKGYKISCVIAIALLIFSLIYSSLQINNYKRDESLLKDIYAIGKIVPQNDIINIPYDMSNDWGIICYFERYFDISLEYRKTTSSYFIIRKNLSKSLVPLNYKLCSLKTDELDLYKFSK